MLDKLETVLSHLLEYHSTLLDLGKEKITVITNKDIDRFEKITLEEQALVRKIEQEEKQRVTLLKELFADHIPADAFTLENCLQTMPDSLQKERIKKTGSLLLATIEDLIQCNTLNRQLVRDSLNYVNFTLDLLRPPKLAPNNYGSTGKQGAPSMMEKKSMFDSQA